MVTLTDIVHGEAEAMNFGSAGRTDKIVQPSPGRCEGGTTGVQRIRWLSTAQGSLRRRVQQK